jgi:hypothetical protein
VIVLGARAPNCGILKVRLGRPIKERRSRAIAMQSTPSMHVRECLRLAEFLIALSYVLTASALPLHAQPAPTKSVTLAAIIESMEARQKLADSVAVQWTKISRYRAGALLPKQSEFTHPCEMLLKGASVHYVGKSFLMSGGVTLVDHTSSYDGKESRSLQGTKPPRGSINDQKGTNDVNNLDVLPLMLYFRPLAEPYDTLGWKTLKLLDERRTIDGRECVTVDDGRTRVDLDRERDFVPVAFHRYNKDGLVVCDGSLEYYRKQDAMRWYPKAFQVTTHAKGQQGVPNRTRGERVQIEIGAPLKDSDFALIFEPGTVVWDARTREEYRIREDGSKEPIERARRRRAPVK